MKHAVFIRMSLTGIIITLLIIIMETVITSYNCYIIADMLNHNHLIDHEK